MKRANDRDVKSNVPSIRTCMKEDGFVGSLLVDQSEISLPWGIEAADPWGFFTSSEISNKCIFDKVVDLSDSTLNVTYDVTLGKSKVVITCDEFHSGNEYVRNHLLSPKDNIYLADFVTRYQFKKEFFQTALIDGHVIRHTNSLINHMYKTDKVELTGEEFVVEIQASAWEGASKFDLYCYVSDQFDKWVVHFRLLPAMISREYFKICKAWANSQPLPYYFGKILMKIPGIKERFYFGGERIIPRKLLFYFNPTIFPYSKLNMNDNLRIETRLHVDRI